MERFVDPCCSECTHTGDNPCRQFVECCVDGPLCHESEECKKKRKAIMDRVAVDSKFVIH